MGVDTSWHSSTQKVAAAYGALSLKVGVFLGVDRRSGDYQETFSDYLKTAVPLYVSRQPNLQRDCRNRLPSYVLAELRDKMRAKKKWVTLDMPNGARTPHGMGSDDSDIESGTRNQRGLAPLIRARDKIEPPGGAVLKWEGERPTAHGPL
jgi:hypothetical protein